MAATTATKRPGTPAAPPAPRRAADDPGFARALERQRELCARDAELRAERDAAAAVDPARAYLERRTPGRPVEEIDAEIATVALAKALVAEEVEAARMAASRDAALILAPARAQVAARMAEALATAVAGAQELEAIDARFVTAGYRRSALPGWGAVHGGVFQLIARQTADLRRALATITEAAR